MNPETAILNLVTMGYEPGAMAYLGQFGVAAEWFIEPKNRLLFQTVERLTAKGIPVDPVNITHELKRTGVFELAGGTAHLSSICDSHAIMGHAEHYIQLLREGRTRRELHLLGKELQAAIANPEEKTVAEIIGKAFAAARDEIATATTLEVLLGTL